MTQLKFWRMLALVAVYYVLASCTHNIPLDSGLSESVISGTRIAKGTAYEIAVNSNLPEPFVYQNGAYSYEFNVNSTFQQKIEEYVELKFQGSGSSGKINVHLRKLALNYEVEQSAAQVLWFGGGTGKVHATMEIKVSMFNGPGKRIASKTITSSANTHAAMGGGKYETGNNTAKIHDIYGTAVNQCLNKAIIKIDRFISTQEK